jgi:hypothetical protein|tara:strand:+ start:2670 stop:3062 length:393 start_codon:yes stop_codon:yes gene_type:complete
MNRHELQEFDINTIASIKPKYDYDGVVGGHFVVNTNLYELSFNVSMSNVINHKLEKEESEDITALFDFIANNFKDLTISHAVTDLYDLGFPVDEWVIDYISYLNTKRKDYSAMLSLLAALQDFGDDDKNL